MRSNFATATTRLSSWMRVPWISPEVEQPMIVERGNVFTTRSIGAGLSSSSDAPNIITSVRSESSAASGSDDHAPPVKLYVRTSIVHGPFVRSARRIREPPATAIPPTRAPDFAAESVGVSRGMKPPARADQTRERTLAMAPVVRGGGHLFPAPGSGSYGQVNRQRRPAA